MEIVPREPTGPLSPAEKKDLAAEEMILGQVEDAMLAGWQSLWRIRERGLYREQGSFDDYIARRWPKFSRSRVYQQLGHVEMLAALGVAEDDQSFNEAQSRALRGFPRGLWKAVYERARTTAPAGGLTAAWIERVGREVLEAVAPGEEAAPGAEDEGEALAGARDRTQQPRLHPVFRAADHCRKMLKQLRHVLPEEAATARAMELAGELTAELERLGESIRPALAAGDAAR